VKRLTCLLLSSFIFLAPAGPAFAWGDNGHQTVGKIASLRIKKRTSQKIAAILKPGETLANISTWADGVKDRMGKSDPDPDTNAFLQDIAHNEKNREWHYDDLPLDCRNYQTCTGFTPDNDLVHMLNICIRTLQGHPDPNYPLGQRNALKLLVHFLGDMHQPLHIGCGYIDVNGPNGKMVIARNPKIIKQKNLPSDNGANQLVIDNDRKKLHGFWDFDLVTSLMQTTNKQTSEELGSFLKDTVRPLKSWNPHGSINGWAAQWATDSLQQSRYHTYKGLAITGQRTITVTTRNGEPLMRDGKVVTDTVYDITRPSNYEAVNRELVRQQLAKAGYRLARLLDAIYSQ
jgi:hypothetical protein